MKLVLGTTLIAILLGIAIDLVTAHVAVDYFAVHHPYLIPSAEPLPLALAWGVAASWWFGAIAGAILWLIRRRLSNPPPERWVLVAVAKSSVAIWATMMAVLVSVYLLANLVPEHQRKEDFDYNRRLMAVAVAHQTEYVLGGIALVVVGLRMRRISRIRQGELQVHSSLP